MSTGTRNTKAVAKQTQQTIPEVSQNVARHLLEAVSRGLATLVTTRAISGVVAG